MLIHGLGNIKCVQRYMPNNVILIGVCTVRNIFCFVVFGCFFSIYLKCTGFYFGKY